MQSVASNASFGGFLSSPSMDPPSETENKKLSNLKKFSLFLWEDSCKDFREFRAKICVVFMPTIFILFFVILRLCIEVEEEHEKRYDTIDYQQEWISMLQKYSERKDLLTVELLANNMITIEDSIENFPYNVFIPQLILCFAPNTLPGYKQIMDQTSKKLNSIDIIGFRTCEELRESMQKNFYLVGVCFNEIELTEWNSYNNTFPHHLNYSIVFPSEIRQYQKSYIGSNWKTYNLFETGRRLEDRISNDDDGSFVIYVREGFISLQHAVAESYLSLTSIDKYTWNIDLQQYPYCKHDCDKVLTKITVSLPLAIIIGFIYPIMYFLKNIRRELESGLQAVVKILGIPYWIQYITTHFNGFLNMILASFFLTIVLKIHWNDGYGIFSKSAFSAIMLLMIVYNLASLSFCMLCLSVMKRTKFSHILLAIVWILTYLPYMQREIYGHENTLQIFVYFFSNTAMAVALDNTLSFEEFGKGIKLKNLFSDREINLFITNGSLILIMFAQSIVYLIIAACLEKMSTYKKVKENKRRESAIRDSFHSRQSQIIEVDVQYKKVVIEIRNVTKYYNNVPVINNVSMNICHGDITVLMGHNSSGKTTLLSMVVGLVRPTRGSILINGEDISTKSELGMSNLGISIGDATLISNLTVKEQLSFFCALKGVGDSENQMEVQKYISAMKLEEKSDTLTQYLSAGKKQFLKVSCALIGGSKIVVLDKPCMGLDLDARKLLCTLLLSEKTNRTMFLASHSSDETDALADRIGILSGGKLQCYGTSYFLKNLYASPGYRLFLIKNVKCDIEKVTKTVAKFIPGIEPEYVLGNQITYVLEEIYEEVFHNLLKEIYEQHTSLNIISFSIYVSSLYEVFVHRGSEFPCYGDSLRYSQIMNGISFYEKEHKQFHEIYNYEPLTGFQLWISHYYALTIKFVAFHYHYAIITILQLVTPIVFTLISINLASLDIRRQELKPMTFSLDQYKHSTTIFSVAADMSEYEITNLVDLYQQNLFWKQYDHAAVNIGNENIANYFLKKQLEINDYVNHNYLIGAAFKKNHITAWFNNYPLHSAPLSLNVIHNVLAQYNDLNGKITLTIDPLPFSTDSTATLDTFVNLKSSGFFLPRNIALCFAIFWPFRCHFFTRERTTGFKIVQSIAGLTEMSYWMSSFLTNITFVAIQSILMITFNFYFVASFDRQIEVAVWFLIILLISGVCITSLTYLLSIFFKDFNIAYIVIVIFLLFNIVCYCIFCEVLYEGFGFNTNTALYHKIKLILRTLPFFSMTRGLEKVFRNGNIHSLCKDKIISIESKLVEECNFIPNCCDKYNMLSWQGGVVKELLCLAIITTITWALIYLLIYRDFLHYQKFRNLNFALARKEFEEHHNGKIEKSVLIETLNVGNMTKDKQLRTPLICDQVTFSRNREIRIKKLSFAINSNECFGILGVNGSGKSTLLKLLVGIMKLTEGHIKYEGVELKGHKTELYKMVGYMADVDFFMDEYTGWQILKMVSLYRGIPRYKIAEIINIVSKILGFHTYLHQPYINYSLGNKRKVNFAVAILGKTKILLLDNPSRGIDIASHRIIYNLICQLQEMGRAIVFCSGTGIECEYYANRIAILDRGRFHALGTHALITEFEKEVFILQVKVKSFEVIRISRFGHNRNQFFHLETFMDIEYPNKSVIGIWGNVILYAIPLTDNVTLSQIFTNIQSNYYELRIEHFQISTNSMTMFFKKFTDSGCAF